MWFRN